ncbi:MAG: hypothetical protein WCJ35_25745 [Planctomycetota bacterium]
MPITINVGLSKKLGTANYGSVGATCNVNFEAGHDLLESDLAGFHQKVKNAFVACRQAVQDELGRELNVPASNGTTVPEPAKATNGNGAASSNGASNGHTNGNGGHNGSSGHGASEKQLAFARQLSKGIQGLGIRRLESLAERMFGKPLVSLTTLDASGLIDSLKAIKEGRIDLNSVLEGNAA